MQITRLFGQRAEKRRNKPQRRALRLESLETRNLMAGDVGVEPPVPDAGDDGSAIVIEYDFGDAATADDILRFRLVEQILLDSVTEDALSLAGATTEVVDGGQDAARLADAATDIVDGGQDAARLADAATEIVDGGQDAARLAGAATEIVDGGQDAARLAGAATDIVDGGQAARIGNAATEIVNGGQKASRFAHLPKIYFPPEAGPVFSELTTANFAGDLEKATELRREFRALEVIDYGADGIFYRESGKPYVPASSVDEVVDVCSTGLETCSAGRKLAGQVVGAVGTVADFVVDPVLGTIFYDANLKTGEKVFGEDSYCSEVYANLQCVPALGGPLADSVACITEGCQIIAAWWSSDEGPSLDEAQAAVKRYRDLGNRKDYDANHGNKYQAYLWEKVLEAKAQLRSLGINPAAVR